MTGGRDPITLDVMIIGAGPSALMAADYLAHAGRRVVLMEGKASPARKFLMAGKSGLNLTMDEPLEAFLAAYGPSAAPLEPMIRAFGPEARALPVGAPARRLELEALELLRRVRALVREVVDLHEVLRRQRQAQHGEADHAALLERLELRHLPVVRRRAVERLLYI